MNQSDIKALLEIGEERPNLDYKSSQKWDVDSYIKDFLAMANTKDGGKIVIGVAELKDGSFVLSGIKKRHEKSYKLDIMKDQVGVYADPYIDFSLNSTEMDSNTFLIISVREFDEVPIVCKKDGKDVNNGTVYIRTKTRRPESSKIKTYAEMRSLIDIAVDKGMHRLDERGYTVKSGLPTYRERFDEQKRDLND